MNYAPLSFRSVSEADRSVECIASSEAVDSYGEIVDQRSLKLDRYLTNPVVLFGHNSRELPIGHASNVRVDGTALRAKIHFAKTSKADEVFDLVSAKVLRGVSIGFVPGRATTEKRRGQDVTVLYDGILHEISVVPIPANPEVLLKAKAMGVADPVITREYLEALWRSPADAKLSKDDEALLERANAGEHFPSLAELRSRRFSPAFQAEMEALASVSDAQLAVMKRQREEDETGLARYGESFMAMRLQSHTVRFSRRQEIANADRVAAREAEIASGVKDGAALADKIWGGK